jgi:large subunit ribosomal protein L29
MKTEQLTGKTDEELANALRDTEKHLFMLRFQSATDRLETPTEIRKAKRDIARIKTIQRQRELARLAALPAADLARMTTELESKTTGPGKRRVKRALQRLTHLQATKKGSAQ